MGDTCRRQWWVGWMTGKDALKKTRSRSWGTEGPTTLRSHHLHVNEQSLPPCEDTDDPMHEVGEQSYIWSHLPSGSVLVKLRILSFRSTEALGCSSPLPLTGGLLSVGWEVNALRQKSQHRSQCSISFSCPLHSLIIISTFKIEHFINYLEIS